MTQASISKAKTKIKRLRDSATLVLWRQIGRHPALLMGRRAETEGPWAGMYVFPGGAVDPSDWRVRAARELDPQVAVRLDARGRSGRALALAAIRETFEETGILLGRRDPSPTAPVPDSWRTFFATGLAPDLGALDYILRAITPVARPKRFNSRFLLANGTEAVGTLAGSGELVDLGWVPLPEVGKLKLPNITAHVLGNIETALTNGRRLGDPVTVHFMRYGRRITVSE